jgi:hypothetical protein
MTLLLDPIRAVSDHHVSVLRAALQKHIPNISSDVHSKIVDDYLAGCSAMSAASSGNAPTSRMTPMSPLAASADSRNHALLRRVQASCKRLGFDLDLRSDRPINTIELDRALRKSDDIELRCAIRSQLFQAGLIAP